MQPFDKVSQILIVHVQTYRLRCVRWDESPPPGQAPTQSWESKCNNPAACSVRSLKAPDGAMTVTTEADGCDHGRQWLPWPRYSSSVWVPPTRHSQFLRHLSGPPFRSLSFVCGRRRSVSRALSSSHAFPRRPHLCPRVSTPPLWKPPAHISGLVLTFTPF